MALEKIYLSSVLEINDKCDRIQLGEDTFKVGIDWKRLRIT